MNRNRIITAFLISASLTAILIAVMVIVGQLHAPFKAWLAATFYHHWLGKGALAKILFIVGGVILSFVAPKSDRAQTAAVRALTWISILSALIIIAFFTANTICSLIGNPGSI